MSLIAKACGFVLGPVVDLYEYTCAKRIDNAKVAIVSSPSSISTIKKKLGQPLTPDQETKIGNLLTKMGYDPSKVIMRFDEKRSGGMAFHSGSIKQWGFCILAFSERFLKEIEKGIDSQHEFVIAHEMAHDDIED